MTTFKFFADNSGLYGFEISGHSTESEKDIEGKLVCSAVSSAAYLAANTITDVIGDSCETHVLDGYMKIIVKNVSEASHTVLKGLRLHISELSKQYDSRLTTTTEV